MNIDWGKLSELLSNNALGLLVGLGLAFLAHFLTERRDNQKWQHDRKALEETFSHEKQAAVEMFRFEKEKLELVWQQRLQELEIEWLREERNQLRERILKGVDVADVAIPRLIKTRSMLTNELLDMHLEHITKHVKSFGLLMLEAPKPTRDWEMFFRVMMRDFDTLPTNAVEMYRNGFSLEEILRFVEGDIFVRTSNS